MVEFVILVDQRIYNKYMEITLEIPWPKIRFRNANGTECDGYLYYVLADKFYVSQNQSSETMGLAQNWIINSKDIIKFYDKKYGFNCSCGMSDGCHTLVCEWQTLKL
jgi:hypothetical protein